MEYNYKKLTPFKMQCLTNFPFIDEDFDALSNYGLLCKIVEYMNNISSNNNLLVDNINDLNNWFKNLDVTEEINNKLDNMVKNGDFDNIIKNYIDPIYNDYENRINNEVSEIRNIAQTVASGSPAGVYNTIAELQQNDPDHSKIYLVKEDGEWYYYNNTTSQWDNGGVYQSMVIANDSIVLAMLNNTIRDNFNMSFSEKILPESYQSGFYTVDDGNVTLQASESYASYIIDLEINNTYIFNGYNFSSLSALIITDGNNNVIYNSNPNKQSGAVSHIFNIQENGLKAYISPIITNIPKPSLVMLRKLENVYNNLKVNNTLKKLATLNGYYPNITTSVANNNIAFTQADGYITEVYEISAGVTYKINYKSFVAASGAVITDLEDKIIWINEKSSEGEYEFTSNVNGFIYLTNYENYVKGNCEIILKAINIQSEISNLKGKKIIYDGDSICESRLNINSPAYNGGSYPALISNITNSTYVNQAVGGARLSSTINIIDRHSVVDNLINLPVDGDLYCFEGGVNDYFSGVSLGSFDKEDYTSELDITTISGALEKIFRYSIENFVGKPIVFIIIHKISEPFVERNGYNFSTLRSRIIEICEKYGIPYFDGWKLSGLNGMIDIQKNNFLNASSTGVADGLHPNINGYKKYYVPQITKLFESVIEKNS